MCLKYLTSFAFGLVLGLTGCATQRMDVASPEACPLGRDIEAYRAPYQLPAASASLDPEEPTGVIDLRQALALAMMRNPELAASSWEVRAKEAGTLQAGLFPNPEPGFEIENFGGSGPSESLEGAETTLHVSQLIELGGKRSRLARVAALERDLAGWDYESKRLGVLTRATKAFVDVLAAQERLALTEDLVRLAEQVFGTVTERVKSGKVSPVEESKAGVVLATSRIELERARRHLEVARSHLTATWGGSSAAFEEVDGRLDVVKPIPPAEQLVRRISQNPDIARWVAEMEQRQAAAELEDARRIPDLTLSGGVKRSSEANTDTYVLGVSIPLPIFDRNQGGTLEARYRLAKAGEERKASEVRVRTRLTEAYEALSTAFAEATALRDDVLPAARTAFDAASEGYRQGKFGYLDVLDAQRTLFEARGQFIETLAAYHKAVADVEHLIGERLDAVENTSQ
jgi:cobalt-zinc-cadmium efflux system outer membrane protein